MTGALRPKCCKPDCSSLQVKFMAWLLQWGLIHSALTSFWVLDYLCMSLLSVHMLPKSSSCVSSIMQFLLSYTYFAFHNTTFGIKLQYPIKNCSAIFLFLARELTLADCSPTRQKERNKSQFEFFFPLPIHHVCL